MHGCFAKTNQRVIVLYNSPFFKTGYITNVKGKLVDLGTNDCFNEKVSIEAYEENLILLVEKFRGLGAIPILHTPNLIIKELGTSRASLDKYVAVIRKVALEENIILVDNYGHWLETAEKTDGINVNKEWLNDPLHPDGEGQAGRKA